MKNLLFCYRFNWRWPVVKRELRESRDLLIASFIYPIVGLVCLVGACICLPYMLFIEPLVTWIARSPDQIIALMQQRALRKTK